MPMKFMGLQIVSELKVKNGPVLISKVIFESQNSIINGIFLIFSLNKIRKKDQLLYLT